MSTWHLYCIIMYVSNTVCYVAVIYYYLSIIPRCYLLQFKQTDMVHHIPDPLGERSLLPAFPLSLAGIGRIWKTGKVFLIQILLCLPKYLSFKYHSTFYKFGLLKILGTKLAVYFKLHPRQPRPQALTKPPHHQLIVGNLQHLAGEAPR